MGTTVRRYKSKPDLEKVTKTLTNTSIFKVIDILLPVRNKNK